MDFAQVIGPFVGPVTFSPGTSDLSMFIASVHHFIQLNKRVGLQKPKRDLGGAQMLSLGPFSRASGQSEDKGSHSEF